METGNKQLIFTFTIPNYLREVQISKAQRSKYYEWDGITIKAKGKKLLKKYIKNDEGTLSRIIYNNGNICPIDLKEDYQIISYNGKFLLADKDKNLIIANETQAGKPKRLIIKGQDMYSGVLNEFSRAKIVNELKASYYNHFKTVDRYLARLERFTNSVDYPIYIHLEIHDTIRNKYDRSKIGDGIRWDVGNRAYPYLKTFVDFMVNGYNEIKPMIVDDDRLHVMGEGYSFHPIDEDKESKLIFKIYKL